MTAPAIRNIRTRQEWSEIISTDWRRSIEGIIQTGRDLIGAQAELSTSVFKEMVKADLPFTRRTAEKLIKIAEHPVITNTAPGTKLPSSWTVLESLSSLSAEDFKDAQERGLIGIDTSKRKAAAIEKAYNAPINGAVGEGANVAMLPSPKEAKEIARATNRMVAASDGNLYSGATDEEGAEYVRRREQTYGVIDAINTIVDCGVTPKEWCEQVKEHWLNRFEVGRIDTAMSWLNELRPELKHHNRIVDCEVDADAE